MSKENHKHESSHLNGHEHTHGHSAHSSFRCSSDASCTHEHHNHNDLYAHPDEIPAIFSHSNTVNLRETVVESDLTPYFKNWMEAIRDWTVENKYLIGHIKSFIEFESGSSIWIASTGKDVNIKITGEMNSFADKFKISMTLIVFGIEQNSLKNKALECLNQMLKLFL